jgi:AcrR family transcriptional regulator
VTIQAADTRDRYWSRRQSEILDALQALFLAEGFRRFTVADLVERLRCSRRTLYSLAPSREELVLVVIDRLLTQMGIEARAAIAAYDDPGDAIAVYLGTAVTTLRYAQPVFTEDLEAYLPTKHLYDRHLAIALRVLGGLVEDGVAAGIFRDLHPPLIAEILDAAVERIRRPDVLSRAGIASSEAIDELSSLIRKGLQVDPVGVTADGHATAR